MDRKLHQPHAEEFRMGLSYNENMPSQSALDLDEACERPSSGLWMDLSGAGPSASTREPLPAGTTVEAEIVEAHLGEAKTSDRPMVILRMLVVRPEEYAGAVVYDNVVLAPSCAWKFKSLCAASTGPDGRSLLSKQGTVFAGKSVQDFVGNVVRFRTSEPRVTSSGNTINRVAGGYERAWGLGR